MAVTAEGFRSIAADHPIPIPAASLLSEYLKMPDVKPEWMMGDGHRREWLCPIYGPSAELELLDFMYSLVRLIKPELAIEGGCHLGLASFAIGRALQDNKLGKLITSDVNWEYTQKTRLRCEGLPVEVRDCCVMELPIEEADFVFIDNDGPGITWQARADVLKLTKPGALALIHDTAQEPELAIEVQKYAHHVSCFQTWRGFSLVQL